MTNINQEQFRDRPVTSRELFVDRSRELDQLEKLTHAFGDIIGITGQRGSGKTSILNILKPKEGKKIFIVLQEKDSKLDIIIDLTYQLAEQMENDSLFAPLKERIGEIKSSLLSEKECSEGKEAGISAGIEARINKTESRIETHTIYLIKTRLAELIRILISKTKAILIIDELDKEKKEDIAKILDSIKMYLRNERIVTFVALPPSLSQEYYRSMYHSREETHNLENVLDRITELDAMADSDIRKIIEKRLPEEGILDHGALELIVEYANGNPRRAIRPVHDLIIEEHERITSRIMGKFLRNELEKQVASLELTKKEEEALDAFAHHVVNIYFEKEADAVDVLMKRKVINVKPRGYVILKQLIGKNALIKEKNRVYIPRHLRLYYVLKKE